MSLKKDKATQFLTFFMFTDTTHAGKTGDAANITVYLSKDGATPVVSTNSVTEMDATNMPGCYQLALTQAETAFGTVSAYAVSTTVNIECLDLVTVHPSIWLFDGVSLEDLLQNLQAVAYGIADKTTTGVDFNKRDGTTTKVSIIHDNAGARTGSTLS